jgi:hypothetical protein
MARTGGWLAFFGVLFFVLPRFGVQHIAFAWLGDAAEPVAIGLVVVGLALMVAGWVRRKPAQVKP